MPQFTLPQRQAPTFPGLKGLAGFGAQRQDAETKQTELLTLMGLRDAQTQQAESVAQKNRADAAAQQDAQRLAGEKQSADLAARSQRADPDFLTRVGSFRTPNADPNDVRRFVGRRFGQPFVEPPIPDADRNTLGELIASLIVGSTAEKPSDMKDMGSFMADTAKTAQRTNAPNMIATDPAKAAYTLAAGTGHNAPDLYKPIGGNVPGVFSTAGGELSFDPQLKLAEIGKRDAVAGRDTAHGGLYQAQAAVQPTVAARNEAQAGLYGAQAGVQPSITARNVADANLKNRQADYVGMKPENTGTWSIQYTDQGAVMINNRTGEIRSALGEQGVPLNKAEKPKPTKPLPTSAAQKLMENNQNLRKAEEALKLISGKSIDENTDTKRVGDANATGFWKGIQPNILLNYTDPEGVDTRAAIGDLGSMVVHDRSGAAVTAAEFPRLRPFIPLVSDPPEVVKKKLTRFVAEYRAIVQEAVDFYTESGYNVPSETLQQITPGSQSKLQQKKPEAAPSRQAGREQLLRKQMQDEQRLLPELQQRLGVVGTEDERNELQAQIDLANKNIQGYAQELQKLGAPVRASDALPAPSATAKASAVPKVGEVRSGYRFKGGDPNKQTSWEPAK